jgi:hypothetical protein
VLLSVAERHTEQWKPAYCKALEASTLIKAFILWRREWPEKGWSPGSFSVNIFGAQQVIEQESKASLFVLLLMLLPCVEETGSGFLQSQQFG